MWSGTLIRSEGLVLLDTHVWIWSVGTPKNLSRSTSSLLERAGPRGNTAISAISLWELAMLAARGRTRLNLPCGEWMETALDARGISIIPISPAIAAESCSLPGNLHGDPADRLIVATARHLGIPLVTRDSLLLEYAAQGHLRAIEA